jgi:hypothetical protein
VSHAFPCIRNGGVNLDVFINQLLKHGSLGGWHFAAELVRLKEGDDILGLTPTPECAALAQTLQPDWFFPARAPFRRTKRRACTMRSVPTACPWRSGKIRIVR